MAFAAEAIEIRARCDYKNDGRERTKVSVDVKNATVSGTYPEPGRKITNPRIPGEVGITKKLTSLDPDGTQRTRVRPAHGTKLLDRITSYNVCYTKLLRCRSGIFKVPAVNQMSPFFSVGRTDSSGGADIRESRTVVYGGAQRYLASCDMEKVLCVGKGFRVDGQVAEDNPFARFHPGAVEKQGRNLLVVSAPEVVKSCAETLIMSYNFV